MKQKGAECQPEKLWLQITYFCDCENIIKSYLLVGTTNYLSQFFEMIESLLPLFFRETGNLYNNNTANMNRKTKYKAPLKPETVKIFKTNKIWQMENNFYIFIQTKFNESDNDFKRAQKQLPSFELKSKDSKL